MKIAGVQMDVKLGQVDENVSAMIERLEETRAQGAELTVFPECAATGYCFESVAEALPFSETVPGPVTEKMSAACARLGGYAAFGMLENDGNDGVFNAAVLVGPDGVIGSYRKVHLPFLGIDMVSTYGDQPFAVHQMGELKVGMNICYDSAFPESSRCLALLGAELIILPTNWPPGAECVAQNVINTRAMENAVYYMAVNRVGTERGFDFIGQSRICAPNGQTMAESVGREEEILYADIDPEIARNKRVVREPGKHAIDRIADRRPEMYSPLVQPHNLKTPGRE
jgi:predicted amidohydrolase